MLVERPNIYEFEKALISIGMEESDAKRYALSTGRSWTVLRRQRATNVSIRHPAWLDAPQSASLGVLCLLGAWNADKEADREIVERLASRPYADIDRELQHLAQLDDAPLLRIGTVWKTKSPLELLTLFGARLTKSELDRFFAVAREMLVAPDPQLDLPDEERYAAAVYGKVHPYSGLLFDSVCDALVKLAVRGAEQPGLHALGIEGRVGRFVHELLDGADGLRWLSLSSYLRTLAEAAPAEFLTAVEKSLRQPDAPIARLLTESKTSGIGGRCWHAGLLWALETLAWAPSQLARVTLVLAQLTHVPVQGNWGNTPGRSLLALFRSWLPQTAAAVQDRIQVLDLLIKKDSDVAFSILEGLTAPGQQTGMYAARPKWREDDAGAGHGATRAEWYAMQVAAKERFFHLSQDNPSRIATLFQNTSQKNVQEEVFKVLALMEPFAVATGNDEDRGILRGALRKAIHWHRNYSDSPSEELEAWLQAAESYYARLAPADLVRCHSWLFDSHWVELTSRTHDVPTGARHDALNQARISALAEIFAIHGMTGIDALVAACAEPGTVGATLAAMDSIEVHWPKWFVANGGDFTRGTNMTWCIRGFLHATPSRRSIALLKDVVELGDQQTWDAAKIARFLILARSEQETWQLTSAFGAEVDAAYWASVWHSFTPHAKDTDLAFVLRRLLESKRPRTALQCCQYDLDSVEANLLYAMLQQFLAGEEQDGPRLDSWHLGEMLEKLEKSNAIDRVALIQLEFGLFPALGYDQETRATALYAGLMSEPALLTDLISLLYKPEHGERSESVCDANTAAAERAWRILQACTRQPGTQADGSIDPNAFAEYIVAARELCRQADRLIMCDQTLGQILAHAPADDDGTWPFVPAREVLDQSDMEEMRIGFHIGTRNKRGITSRSPWAGGGQERDLSAYYRGFAERVRYSHPNVAATLDEIAKSYEREGTQEDVQASLRKEGY